MEPENGDLKSTPGHPGTVEELHQKNQSVYPLFFEGAKVLISRGLSNNFQVTHNISMNSSSPSEYRFGATYVGENIISPTDMYPILVADVSPSGDMNANIIHAFSSKLKTRFSSQIKNSVWTATQFTTEYFGSGKTACFTAANPDLINGTGVALGHYLQSVTDNLALGAELAYQSNPSLPGGHIAYVSLAAKYTTSDSVLAATIGNGGQLHASFYQSCGEKLQVGTEIQANLSMGESVASLAYALEIPQGNFSIKSSVDSNFVVKSSIEKKLAPFPFTFALCSLLNHKKQQYQFGVGFFMG